MPTYVECCLSNATEAFAQDVDALDVDLRTYRCLEQCGHCFNGPFMVVDGTLHRGESQEALIAELRRSIQCEAGR